METFGQAVNTDQQSRVNLIKKALTSAVGSGSGLIPQVLDKIVTDTAARLSPLPNLMSFLKISGKKYDFNRILTLPEAIPGQGENSTTYAADVTTELASATLKVFKKKSAVSDLLRDASEENINAVAFAIEATVRSVVYDFENTLVWGNATANPYDFDGFDNTISTNRQKEAVGGAVLSGLDLIDDMIDALYDKGGVNHDAFLLCSPYMQSKISQLLTNVRLNQPNAGNTQQVNIGGGWRLEAYRGIPIAPISNLRPKKTTAAVTAGFANSGGTCPDATYYFRVAVRDINGENLAYQVTPLTTTGGSGNQSVITLTVTAAVGALAYKVYCAKNTSDAACVLCHEVPGRVYDSTGTFAVSTTQTINTKVVGADANGRVITIAFSTDPSVAGAEIPSARQAELPYVATDLAKPEETILLIDADINQGMGLVPFTNSGGDRMGGWITSQMLAKTDLATPFIVSTFATLAPKWEATSSIRRGVRVR